MNIWLIAIGGFIGALCRYFISKYMHRSTIFFPSGTFLVNMVGTLLLGVLLGCSIQGKWLLLAGTGFCGALTTFSTLQWEILRFQQGRHLRKFSLYLTLSYALGILFGIAGDFIGKSICS